MRVLAVLLAIVAVSSAASIMTMDDKELEKVMMEQIASQGNMNAMMDILALMDAQQQPQEEPEAVVAEGEEEATHDGAEGPTDDKKEVAAVEAEDPQPHPNMFDNGIMGATFPEMMTGAIPHAARKPSKKPTVNNGNRKPTNGKRGGTSAAAASANSFSRGPNSFASSQAQAFSRGSK